MSSIPTSLQRFRGGAAAGFLERAKRGSLNFAANFLDDVHEHVEHLRKDSAVV